MTSIDLETAGAESATTPTVVIFSASFPPAYLRGGPSKSVAGIVEGLAESFKFSVVTSAHDDDPKEAMPGVKPNVWVSGPSESCVIRFASPGPRLAEIVQIIRSKRPTIVYLNSFFNLRFSLIPMAAALAFHRRCTVLLAPRGEFSRGALEIHAFRKRFFILWFTLLGLHKRVLWHASTSLERRDIQAVFPSVRNDAVREALDLRQRGPQSPTTLAARTSGNRESDPSGLEVVFLSRIVPKKNLLGAITALSAIETPVRLTIAGPLEDSSYWEKCEEAIGLLPPRHQVRYAGSVESDLVIPFLSEFDLFLLPTFGENFGHVILEALMAGLFVVVGRDTPWASVEEEGVGLLVDPYSPPAISVAIEGFASKSRPDRDRVREAAVGLAMRVSEDESLLSDNRELFLWSAMRARTKRGRRAPCG